MTEQDLASYQAVRRSALAATFADFSVMVPDLPSGGPALLAALELLPALNSSRSGQGMSLMNIISLANASENIYRKALLGIWGNNLEKVLQFHICKRIPGLCGSIVG
jgi:gamma-glutamyltranspeptidase